MQYLLTNMKMLKQFACFKWYTVRLNAGDLRILKLIFIIYKFIDINEEPEEIVNELTLEESF